MWQSPGEHAGHDTGALYMLMEVVCKVKMSRFCLGCGLKLSWNYNQN